LHGRFVAVVALERADAERVDELADAVGGVGEPAVMIPWRSRPMEPLGRLPVRSSAIAPSVEPNTSTIRTPNRVAASSTTWGDPSLPNATRREVSASSARGGVASR
jgi:hypothetical protein